MESPDEIKAHQRMERGNKERWVLGRWSRQISFKKSSSRVEKGTFFNGVSRKAKGKGFGIACQSVIRVRKRIQNPPRQRRQNVIAQVVGWENPDPTTKMVTTLRDTYPLSP
jgi:hypothetical protein